MKAAAGKEPDVTYTDILYYQTEEATEGRNAFVEKRPVDFRKFRR